MVYGFNSEIKHGDTIYHVQSEMRQNEPRLETQVFVGGRCLGKRASDSKAHAALPELELQDILKAQHQEALGAIREGQLESWLKGIP